MCRLQNISIFASVMVTLFIVATVYGETSPEPTVKVTYTRKTNFLYFFDDTTTIYNNGVLLQTNKYWSLITKLKFAVLSREERDVFRQLVLDADVFTLEDSYTCRPGENECPLDIPGKSITFEIDHNTKHVFVYYPSELPEELNAILNKINSYLSQGFWIHEVFQNQGSNGVHYRID